MDTTLEDMELPLIVLVYYFLNLITNVIFSNVSCIYLLFTSHEK